MHPAYFSVAFRIFHPRLSAEEICLAINLEAHRKWSVGLPKKTIKGDSLKGTNKSTFCLFYLIPPKEMQLEAFLKLALSNLNRHKDYLDLLSTT
jgi:hypothetical protein